MTKKLKFFVSLVMELWLKWHYGARGILSINKRLQKLLYIFSEVNIWVRRKTHCKVVINMPIV